MGERINGVERASEHFTQLRKELTRRFRCFADCGRSVEASSSSSNDDDYYNNNKNNKESDQRC